MFVVNVAVVFQVTEIPVSVAVGGGTSTGYAGVWLEGKTFLLLAYISIS